MEEIVQIQNVMSQNNFKNDNFLKLTSFWKSIQLHFFMVSRFIIKVQSANNVETK